MEMSTTQFSQRPFLFVGTAKAGTTSIYNYLLQHQGLYIPKKETFYFLRDVYRDISLPYPQQRSPETMVLDSQEYESLLQGVNDRVYGEIGTGYLYHHEESIPRIRERFGDEVNILIILRDPVSRAYSSYNHFVKDMHEELSFEEAMKAEHEREKAGWDFMWQHRALGLYASQVKAFQDAFTYVKVLRYEDLKRNPAGLMKEIFEFIGVLPLQDLDLSKQFNPSGQPKSKLIQKLLIHDNPVKKAIRPIVRAMMSNEKRERLRKDLKAKNLKSYDEMTEETVEQLREFYREDIKELSRITGQDFNDWR